MNETFLTLLFSKQISASVDLCSLMETYTIPTIQLKYIDSCTEAVNACVV